MRGKKYIFILATIALIVASIAFVIYIIYNHLGLVDGMDFAAGAYFYADIPDFDKYLKIDQKLEQYPYLFYLGLSLLWAVIVYFLWLIVDKLAER